MMIGVVLVVRNDEPLLFACLAVGNDVVIGDDHEKQEQIFFFD
jgi:hypothetical protein